MNDQGIAPPPFDAWVLARARAGHPLNGEVARVSEPNRSFAERLARAEVEERAAIWDEYIETLPEAVSEALIEAVASVDPEDPAPPEDESWGPPFAFRLPPVDPFPVDVYPDAVARLIDRGSRSIGCPRDFLALPALVVGGAAIGRSATLKLKDGYFATASIYAANIGLAGDGKSPALDKVLKPLHQIDALYAEEWREEMAAYEARLAEYESAGRGTGRRGRRRADGLDDAAGSAEATEELAPDKPTPPTLRRNVVSDTTTEALDTILAENPRGLLQAMDEASALVASMNQYRGGKGSDRQWYLSTWSGQSRTVDRKQNQDRAPIRIPHPFLCFVGGMVPDMIGELADGRGRHDGFLDRFLFAYPDPVPKTGWIEDGVPKDVADAWSELVARLRKVPMVLHETGPAPHVLQFSPAAKQAWRRLIDAHHAEQAGADFPRSLVGPWAKLEQYAGRITLVLHMLRWAADRDADTSALPDVGVEGVHDAGRLLGYLKGHVRRVYAAMRARAHGEDGDDDVQSVLKWIHRHRPESFSVRDLNRDLSKTFGNRPQALEDALAWLVKRDCIRRLEEQPPPGRRGRRRSPVYLVNPHLNGSHNLQNRPAGQAHADRASETDDSVNSADEGWPHAGEEVADETAAY